MTRTRKIAVAMTIILLLVGVAWWLFGRGDAQVEKVKQMQKEMFAAGKPPTREQFEAFRKEMDQLTATQRRQVMERGPGGPRGPDRMRKEMDEYFKLPKNQRAAFLEKRINQMEQRRKEMDSQGPPKGPSPDGSTPPAGPPPGGGPGAGGPGGPPGGGPPGGPGGPGNANPTERKQHMAGMVGRMPASDRARFSAFHDAMAKQRMAMGLSPMPAPPGRPPNAQPRQ